MSPSCLFSPRVARVFGISRSHRRARHSFLSAFVSFRRLNVWIDASSVHYFVLCPSHSSTQLHVAPPLPFAQSLSFSLLLCTPFLSTAPSPIKEKEGRVVSRSFQILDFIDKRMTQEKNPWMVFVLESLASFCVRRISLLHSIPPLLLS